jgi:RNA polymerase sigma-70 factor (ECF subfamily)
MGFDSSRTRLATEQLFDQHAAFVARLLYRLGVASADLDDVVQEVFLVVHRLGGYTPGPATPTTFLANIAFNAARSAGRRARTREARSGSADMEKLASEAHSPVRVLELHDELAELESALATLEPELRALLILVDLEGESCAAIAASQSVPVGTVYWRVHRARRKFRAAVECGRSRSSVAVQTLRSAQEHSR